MSTKYIKNAKMNNPEKITDWEETAPNNGVVQTTGSLSISGSSFLKEKNNLILFH
ncbi:MAG: hypothetical protein H6Q18_1182 [Bacteroidetes bacterium]|nr:hypothetical protein [Bacteroidota bacterium]